MYRRPFKSCAGPVREVIARVSVRQIHTNPLLQEDTSMEGVKTAIGLVANGKCVGGEGGQGVAESTT